MAYLVPSEFVTKMVDAGESKIFMSTRDTVIRAYMAGAILALAAAFAVTVNVSTGVPIVGAMISTTVSGKVIAMWMPIMLFFFMTFEHSIVNMFLFPSGLLLGGKFTVMDYLIWNEIPTVVGNLVGGLAFTGLTLYATHVKTAPKRAAGRIAA